MRFLGFLTLAQLRRNRGRWALLALGVALVTAIPVFTSGLSQQVNAQLIRQTVRQLDLSDRTLLVSQEAESSTRRGTTAAADAAVRTQLARLTAGTVIRELLFRPLEVSGSSFELGGADHLGAATRVVTGRLPRSCSATRCEVVVLGSGDSAQLRQAAATLGVVVVGAVRRTNPTLVTGPLASAGTPVLLADGADRIAAVRSLSLYSSLYAWAAPVDDDRIVSLGVPDYVQRTSDVSADLDARVGGTSLGAPTDQLTQAASHADVSARRLALLGGLAAVLLLGFAVAAAIGLRRETEQLVAVLRRRGATGRQVATLTIGQAVIVSLIGAVAGLSAGALAATTTASDTTRGSVATALWAVAQAVPAGALLTLAAIAVVAMVLMWPPTQARAMWHTLDLIALASLAAVVLAGSRGAASASELSSGTDSLVVALPILVAIVAGLVAARVWGPIVRVVERAVPRASVAGRMGLLGGIRRPLRPVATAGFLAAAVTSVVFAGAYRATLLANNADQAAYRVPLDASVGPSDAVPVPSAPSGLSAGTRVYGVLRTQASVTRLAGVVDSVPVVAPEAAAISAMNRWSRTTGADIGAAALTQRLRLPVAAGPRIPSGARSIAIDAAGADPQTSLSIWVRAHDGSQYRVDLGIAGTHLVGSVPAGAQTGGEVVAFGVAESADYATRHAHAIGEGTGDRQLLSGTITLGAVSIDGAPTRWSWTGWGSLLGQAEPAARTLRLAYRINGAPVIASPGFATVSATAMPIAVDPQTARDAHGGTLNLTIDSKTPIVARIVAVMPRMPTVDGAFILTSRATLEAELNQREPGGNPSDYWVSGPQTRLASALAVGGATVRTRAGVQSELDADPIGRGTRTLLLTVALLALAVAALTLILLVVGERRDGAAELYALEADGTAPSTLRRMLMVRVIAVAAVAVPIGVAAGVALTAAAATLIAVDASGNQPVPGLVATFGSTSTSVALIVGIGAGILAACLVAAQSLRQRYPIAAASSSQ